MSYVAPTSDLALDDYATAQWVGCELTFGVAITDEHGRDAAVAKIARGSTGPVEWDPTDPSKNTSRAVAALRRWIEWLRTTSARDPWVAGAIFIGGEQEGLSDALSASMQTDLEVQVARWRQEFGAIPQFVADLPAHVGGRTDARIAAVNAGIAAAVAADPLLSLLTVSDLAREGDDVHYTADSQIVIGTRAATAAAFTAYDPRTDADAVRVSLYDSLATAQYIARALGGAVVRIAPVDVRWAVEDSYGEHWVSRSAWATFTS